MNSAKCSKFVKKCVNPWSLVDAMQDYKTNVLNEKQICQTAAAS